MTINEFASIIETIGIFKNLDYSHEFLETLFEYCQHKVYKKNSVIIEEGDFGNSMFIALSGTVAIEKKTKFGDHYTVTIIDCDTSHPFFGEIALIESTERTATVRVVQECRCLIIHKEQFDDITNKFPKQGLQMVRRIASTLSQNLRKTTQDMLTLFNALILELSSK